MLSRAKSRTSVALVRPPLSLSLEEAEADAVVVAVGRAMASPRTVHTSFSSEALDAVVLMLLSMCTRSSAPPRPACC